VAAKRCGHRPGKALVSTGEMVDRIKAAVDGRTDPAFVLIARTDAVAVEGLEAAIERAERYREAGADMIFAEALIELGDYRRFVKAVKVPVLANMTEFGVTPLYSVDELRSAGVSLVLYPLSAFRAMSAAALQVYRAIRDDGSQRAMVDGMQSRADLYDYLGYYDYERKLDAMFGKEKEP
jgi:methylisocitrate lyase